MDPAHVVLLIGVAIAIVAIAGYLIAIAMILKHVVNRLVTILGAVQAVTDTAEPVGPIVDDINRDLAAGRKLLEDAVARLESARVPVGATADPATDRHAAPEPQVSSAGGEAASSGPSPAPAEEANIPGQPPPGSGRGWWNR